jgi:hypothetical protein
MTGIIGTISHGTLRHQDLLASFAEAYKQHSQGHFDQGLYVGAKALALYLDNSSNPSEMDFDVARAMLDDLTVKLEEIAAENDCYFGTTEGDGSDFGFWPND